jgi:hypothetical protein
MEIKNPYNFDFDLIFTVLRITFTFIFFRKFIFTAVGTVTNFYVEAGFSKFFRLREI